MCQASWLICKLFPFEMIASLHKADMFALFPVNPGRVVSGGICVWYLRHFSSYFRSTQKRGQHTANQQSGTLTNFGNSFSRCNKESQWCKLSRKVRALNQEGLSNISYHRLALGWQTNS